MRDIFKIKKRKYDAYAQKVTLQQNFWCAQYIKYF